MSPPEAKASACSKPADPEYTQDVCPLNAETEILRIRFSDHINSQCHPRKLRRQPAASPLTRNTPKMSACSMPKRRWALTGPDLEGKRQTKQQRNSARILRIRFSDRINSQCHPQKLRRQPAASPLTRNTPKLSACSMPKRRWALTGPDLEGKR
ncbi:hypothetical protein NDU88_011008 [Pleurodeles waltl]|uniref:Uncharacterized protein n=1 Tax=Pleurodeles waltl TaxID=8319 RepID=A0AAV7RZV0_PLEWA|nr:hypothetical protein NDU88_011008 [Pleurodeles waltl]